MKYTCTSNRMKFLIGEKYDFKEEKENFFQIESDCSLLYNGPSGDYSVMLGGNWRFELIVDSLSGKCLQFQSQLYRLPIENRCLKIPSVEHRIVYFKCEEKLSAFSGCHYSPFCNTVYFDSNNKILCFGDPVLPGRAIEFSPNIISIIDDERLNCIFLKLNNIVNENIFQISKN